jgi:hypothetical protein
MFMRVPMTDWKSKEAYQGMGSPRATSEFFIGVFVTTKV